MRSKTPPAAGPPVSYWSATRHPLYCLVFLLPFVAAYEFGALILRPTTGPEQQLVAQRIVRQAVAWLGTDAFWVPGVALILSLLIWHILSRNPWNVRASVLALMLVESLALTLPLLVLGQLLQQSSDAAQAAASAGVRARIVLALGAGIYEELLFRFVLISGLMLVLVDILHTPRTQAMVATVASAAMLFAVCHFHPVGAERFAWPPFLLLTAAGAYLSTIFVARGLGICTGCHAAYNLILLAMHRAT